VGRQILHMAGFVRGRTVWERLPAAIERFAAGRSIPPEAGKSAKASRRGVIAALIVSSEARPCGGRAYKVWEAFLSTKEGSGSKCALPHRPPACHTRRLGSLSLAPSEADHPASAEGVCASRGRVEATIDAVERILQLVEWRPLALEGV
jgi:hypothetical protein